MSRARAPLFALTILAAGLGLMGLVMLGGCQLVAGIEEATEIGDAGFAPTLPLSEASTPSGCTLATECPRTESPCQRPACVDGRCTTEAELDGPLPVQTPGDCRRIECVNGTRVEVAAPEDPPPDDGRECTTSVCAVMSPLHQVKDVSVPCGDGGTGFCNGSGDCGRCKYNTKVCFPGGIPATCPLAGEWVKGAACTGGAACIDGECQAKKSCDGLAACRGGAQSCCDEPNARGGTFPMGRGTGTAHDADESGLPNEVPEHMATVSPSSLETFPVTVGRFRAFVDQYAGITPTAGSGAHPGIPGSGWDPAFNAFLPADQTVLRTKLKCAPPTQTWTDLQGTMTAEQRPINCVSWYEAFAFCIWDGGRLPTEAEYEYAAAGAEENRKYAWGQVPPTAAHLIGNCNLHAGTPLCTVEDIPFVGSYETGKGRFGHYDLAGSVRVWMLDWYSASFYETVAAGCTDCANLTVGVQRSVRGAGSFSQEDALTRSVTRASLTPASRDPRTGIRCAH